MKESQVQFLQNLEAINYSRRVLNKRNIGIVDDDANQNALIEAYMRKSRYSETFDLFTCTDRKEALNKFLNNDFDLLIIDINLPEPDGFKLGGVVRRFHDGEIPIIYISQCKKTLRILEKEGHKNVIFLPKPFSQDNLIEAIETFNEML